MSNVLQNGNMDETSNLNDENINRKKPRVEMSDVPDEKASWKFDSSEKITGIQVSEDGTKVSSGLVGYRTCRATRGVKTGSHSFTVKIAEMRKGQPADAHVRVGWVSGSSNLNLPVGSDKKSYGFRDMDGSKIFDAWRSPLGPKFGLGQEVKCTIFLPEHHEVNPIESETSSQHTAESDISTTNHGAALNENSSQDGAETHQSKIPGSYCEFFVDGESKGKAFTDLTDPGKEGYFPAVSLYYGPIVHFVDKN